jgi:hypothetical protein
MLTLLYNVVVLAIVWLLCLFAGVSELPGSEGSCESVTQVLLERHHPSAHLAW